MGIDYCHLMRKLEDNITLEDSKVNQKNRYHPLKFDRMTLWDIQDLQKTKTYCLQLRVEETCLENEIQASPSCHSGLIGQIYLDAERGVHKCLFVVHVFHNTDGDYFLCLDKSSDPNNPFHSYPKIKPQSHCSLYRITAIAS